MKWIFLFLACVGCFPTNLLDLRLEAEAEVRKMVVDLQRVETKEDLQKTLPRLKKRFNKIADLLIEARKFQEAESIPLDASESFFIELARIYEIPGGRDLMESAQAESVIKLQKKLYVPESSFRR